MTRWLIVSAALFAGFVAHAAFVESNVDPTVGPCAALHLRLMQAHDWSRAQAPTGGTALAFARLASH